MMRLKEKSNRDAVIYETKKTTALDIVYFILPIVSMLCIIGLWIGASSESPDLFPSISATWNRLLLLFEKPVMRVTYWSHIGASLKRVLLALVAATVIGCTFGVIIGWNKKLNAFFGTIFYCIRPIPPIAWIPLITIAMGIGEFPKMLIVFIGAVMPMVVNTQAGLAGVEDIYLDVGTLFDANRRQMLLEIAIPSALPAILAGFKTATSTAWMVVLAAEMLGASSGVGFLVTRGMNGDDMPLVLVAMITIGVVGAILGIITDYLERWLCPWLRLK